MKPQYLRVRNWERFQHYTNRRPPWIKYHVSILDDHTLLSLKPMTQLVYDRLLLRAALTDNNIEHDPDWLAQKFNLPARYIQDAIETLIDTGFLHVAGGKRSASKAIAKRKQKGVTETEAEPEAKPKTDPEPEDAGGSTFQIPGALKKLMDAMTDRDDLSVKRLSSLAEKYGFVDADYVAAWEAATGPGVKSPSAVALAELKKIGERKAA